MTQICVSKFTTIGSDNGLSPIRRQAIIWTNAGILLIRTLGTNFSEILIQIHTFSNKKMHLKMSSGKWRPFCLGLNVLSTCNVHLYSGHPRLQIPGILWRRCPKMPRQWSGLCLLTRLHLCSRWSLEAHTCAKKWNVTMGFRPLPLKQLNIIFKKYRKVSYIRRTKSLNLNVSCPVLQLSLQNLLKPGVKSRMKM